MFIPLANHRSSHPGQLTALLAVIETHSEEDADRMSSTDGVVVLFQITIESYVVQRLN